MSLRVAFFPGSFDPLTLGHLDLIAGTLALAEKVVVGIGVHAEKAGLFPFEERKRLIEGAADAALGAQARDISVVSFKGLTVDAARENGAAVVVRGLRSATDFDYEMHLAGMNAAMAPDIRTIFIPASATVRPITASLVRQIAALGGDVSPFVPPLVAEALRSKFAHASTEGQV